MCNLCVGVNLFVLPKSPKTTHVLLEIYKIVNSSRAGTRGQTVFGKLKFGGES